MFVRHVMTPEVYTFTRSVRCREAFREFGNRRIRRAPVLERGRMVGIVTLHDLLHVLPGTVSQEESEAGHAAWDLPVEAVMTRSVRVAGPNDHLEAAAWQMIENKIGALPVMREGELAGILTESDIFRALWGILSSGSGWRAIVQAHEGTIEPDYAALLAAEGGRVESLLRFPTPDAGSAVFLRAAGGNPEAIVRALWAAGLTVQEVAPR